VPNAYFAIHLAPDVHLGVGVNAPFGLKTEYDPDWKGRTQAIESEIKTININPSIAWKASESLSLGAGLSLQYAEATLSHFVNGAGIATVHGDDYGWGFNLGLLWQPSAATRVGLAFRYSVGVNYHLNDKTTLCGGLAFDETPTSDAYRTARIPDEDRTWVTFGAQYRMSEKMVLDFGYAHLFVKQANINKEEESQIVFPLRSPHRWR
jgi:long-subunit fatty acid transport protein